MAVATSERVTGGGLVFGAKNESRGRGEEEERERVELCDVPPRKVNTTDMPTFKASNLGGLLMPE